SVSWRSAGRADRCPATEATETSCAATTGSSTCSHKGRAASPVPNPVRPLSRPPISAPAKTSAGVTQSMITTCPWEQRVWQERCQPAAGHGLIAAARSGVKGQAVAGLPPARLSGNCALRRRSVEEVLHQLAWEALLALAVDKFVDLPR